MLTLTRLATLALAATLGAGCASDTPPRDPNYHTSGSRDADQRAEEQVAKDEQLRGKGGTPEEQQRDVKRTLYARLGGEAGIKAIVDDFVTRVIADPRVDFTRRDASASLLHGRPKAWTANRHNVEVLKLHLEQFIAGAAGGPARYDGRSMVESHAGMRISNAEFDAAAGDLAATLDRLGYAALEKKELLALIETTRPQIVTER
jgi:hemoglobin